MKRFVLVLLTTLIVTSFGSFTANGKKTVELRHWTFWDTFRNHLQGTVAEFNKLHPEINFKLSGTTYPFQEMHEKLLISFMARSGAPDIVDIEVTKLGLFLRGDIQIHDLTDFLDQYKGKLVESRLDLFSYKGIRYGIPWHIGTNVMFYNKELFDEAGVDLDGIKTWDDFVRAGKKITKDLDQDGKIDQWMTSVETADFMVSMGIAHQLEGGIYDSKGNIIVDSEQTIKAFQFYSDLYNKYHIATIAPGAYHGDPAFKAFMNAGGVACYWSNWPRWIHIVESMPDLYGKMRIRALPRWDPSVVSLETKKKGGYLGGTGGGTGTCITKQIKDEYLDIAKEFLGHAKLTLKASISMMNYAMDPFRIDAYDDPRISTQFPYWGYQPIYEVVKELLFANEIPPYYVGPRFPEAAEKLLAEIPYNLLEEGMDPREQLEKLADEIRALDES